MKKKKTKKRKYFLRFLTYLRPYLKYVILAIAGGIVKISVPLLMPQVTRHLIDNVYMNSALSLSAKMDQIYFYVGGMMIIFLVVWAPWTYIRHYFVGKARNLTIFDLRCDLYYKILRMSSSFFDKTKSGSIVSRLISDIQLTQNLIGNALTNIWMDLASLIIVLFFLFRINPFLALISMVTFPLYLYSFKKLRYKIKDSSYQVQAEIAEMSGNVYEKIAGSKVVHAFVREKHEEKNFKRDSKRVYRTDMKRVYFQSLNATITGTLVHLAPLIVTFFGGYMVVRNQLTIGELIAVGMYLGALYTPIQRFSELNVVFATSMAALERIFEVMDKKPEIINRPNAEILESLEGYVEFKNVDFSYKRRKRVLKKINFTVEPDMKVALVGASGSGKSTLVSLIPRFYDVDNGSIKMDGRDIRDIKVRSLRRHIGIVLQDPILFSGSIRENIMYGNPKASEGELIQAAQDSNAYDFITSLPNGFSSEVGEDGVLLSGGEKQRITLARAFLKDPRILILDEATSSLDTESELLIQEALKRLMMGRTTFIIAHRLSTIVHADMIFVLQNGRIAETGTHKQLLKSKGIYRNLYEKQFMSARDSWDILNGSNKK